MFDIHFGQAFLRQGRGETMVRFQTVCGQTIRNPAHVTGDLERATCRACRKEISAAVTDTSLRALIWGQLPAVNAMQAFKKEGGHSCASSAAVTVGF